MRVAARGVTNCFWFMVWRDTGASARAPARAAAKRRPPGRGEVERERQSPPLIDLVEFQARDLGTHAAHRMIANSEWGGFCGLPSADRSFRLPVLPGEFLHTIGTVRLCQGRSCSVRRCTLSGISHKPVPG